jgi:hypothetical protein
LGHEEASREALEKLTARWGHITPYPIAQAHAWRGEREQALQWLERAYQAHDAFVWVKTDPTFRSLHRDARYAALLRKVGLPPDAEEERPPTAEGPTLPGSR